MNLSRRFMEELENLNFEDTFNPYSEKCPEHDRQNAPKCRSKTLLSVLKSALNQNVDSIWVGRDLGYRGGRRTGLAFTDDVHIQAHLKRWGVKSNKRPTKGEIIAERTATFIWEILSQISQHVFLWNVFPLHPHEPNKHFSNRPHSLHERRAGEQLLRRLVSLLKPDRVVAIGKDAKQTATHCLSDQCKVIGVRHPSYGGQKQFLTEMRKLYGLS